MKKLNILTLVLTFLLFSFHINAQRAQQFEGTVTVKSSDKEGLNAVFTLKKHMLKMVTKTDEGVLTIITNKKTGDKTTLMDKGEEKTGFKQNAVYDPSMRQLKQQAIAKQKTEPTSKIKITEETKTIGDYECYKVVGSDEKMEAEAWVAKDLNLNMMELFAGVKTKRKEKNAYQEAFGENGFILEMKTKNLESGEEKSMNSTVEAKKIEDTAFDIPKGYKFTDLTNIQGLMKDAAGNAEKLKEIRKAMSKSREN